MHIDPVTAKPLLRPYYAGGPSNDSETVVLLGALCPACRYEHDFRVNAAYWETQGQLVWTFDGNHESPTFVGSMLANAQGLEGRPRCHSYVKDGQWRFLEDSTHELAGKTVPMIPIAESAWPEPPETYR